MAAKDAATATRQRLLRFTEPIRDSSEQLRTTAVFDRRHGAEVGPRAAELTGGDMPRHAA